MAIVKRAAEILSWVFFAAGVGWIFFGPTLLPSGDCNPRALFGCGVLDIGVSGIVGTFVNGAAKFVGVMLFWGVWAVLQRLAHGKWPSLPLDPK